MTHWDFQSDRAKDQLLSTSLALTVVAAITVVLRLWTKMFIVRRFGLDDLCIVLASSCFVANCAVIRRAILPFYLAFQGDIHMLARAAPLSRASVLLYVSTMTLVKMSLGFYFLRLFKDQQLYRAAIYILTIISTLLGLAYFTVGASTCALTAYYFPSRHCAIYSAYRTLARVWGTYNTSTDLIYPLVSIKALWNARLSRKTRVFVCWLLFFAIFGCVASFLRMAILIRGEIAHTFKQTLESTTWTQMEAGVGIICVNVANLRPLTMSFKKWIAARRRGPEPLSALRLDETQLFVSTSPTLGSTPTAWRRLDSALTRLEMQQQKAHDWRDDRITPGEEIRVPPQALLKEFAGTKEAKPERSECVTIRIRELGSQCS